MSTTLACCAPSSFALTQYHLFSYMLKPLQKSHNSCLYCDTEIIHIDLVIAEICSFLFGPVILEQSVNNVFFKSNGGTLLYTISKKKIKKNITSQRGACECSTMHLLNINCSWKFIPRKHAATLKDCRFKSYVNSCLNEVGRLYCQCCTFFIFYIFTNLQ